ncbi:MAG: transketolase C-terminal domain-containing protein [Lentisphaerota bacterium]
MFYMRDSFFERIYTRMKFNDKIFFLTGDVGSPVLDKVKSDFKDRFINVGISEQNMINVSAGLAMEGFEVYAYGIASFFLRCVDQIRNSLLLTNQMKKLNVNLLATGKGVSYETAGPAHHSLEDLPVLNIFPGMDIFVPSDSVMSQRMADELPERKGIKYFCFEGKKSPNFYDETHLFNLVDGFTECSKGKDVCIISQGSILSLAFQIEKKFATLGIKAGVIDVFTSAKNIDANKLLELLSKYKKLLVIEEGYREKGFLISTIKELTGSIKNRVKVYSFGFDDHYIFEVGPREMHYANCGLTVDNVINISN